MELTLLGTVAIVAFLIGGAAVMLVSAFRRTLELRAALLHAIQRIERLEQVVAQGAPAPALETDKPLLLEAPREPTIAELAEVIDADDKIGPPPLGISGVAASIAAFLALAAAHVQWLSGEAGVVLALILGVVLVVLAEWKRRAAPSPPSWRNGATLAATLGLTIMLIGVLYGRWLLDALAPSSSFFLAAALSLAGIALSMWHGPTLLAFALLAGVLAPNMAPIGADRTWPHYVFLFVLTAALASFARRRAAPIWGWLAFAHALFWAGNAAWIGGSPGNIAVEGMYIAGIAALAFVHAWDERGDALPFPQFWRAWRGDRLGLAVLVASATAAGLTTLAVLHSAPTANAGGGLVAFAALSIAAAAMRAQLWFAPMLAAFASAIAIALWPAGEGLVDAPGLLILAAALGLLFSLGGWGAMIGRDPLPGACVAAIAPVLVLAAAYVRVGDFAAPTAWTGAALVLAVISLISHLQLRRSNPIAAAPFAAGAATALAVAAIALAPAPFGPLAMAAAIPFVALADRWRDESGLRFAAILLALTLTAALVLPEIYLASATGPTQIAMLFLPSAIACLIATFVFSRAPARATAMQSITAIGLVIAATCATLAARHFFTAGSINAPYASLAEAGLNSVAWLAVAVALARLFGPRPTPLAFGVEFTAFAAAMLHALIVCGVLINPWWGLAPADTPGWRGLNVIELAFAAPGVGFMFYALIRECQGLAVRAGAAMFAGLPLLLLALVLEIRRLFHGADMAGAPVTGAEAWAYSGALIGFAAFLLAISAERGGRVLRVASLLMALVALAKMAFSDVVSLSGATRVATFFIVALAVGGVIFFYRRFILPPSAARPKNLDPNLAPPTSS